MEKDTTEPACDGHNWEVWNVMPEWRAYKAINREIAIVVCTFCGIVRKTVISNL